MDGVPMNNVNNVDWLMDPEWFYMFIWGFYMALFINSLDQVFWIWSSFLSIWLPTFGIRQIKIAAELGAWWFFSGMKRHLKHLVLWNRTFWTSQVSVSALMSFFFSDLPQ